MYLFQYKQVLTVSSTTEYQFLTTNELCSAKFWSFTLSISSLGIFKKITKSQNQNIYIKMCIFILTNYFN
jgi:hypothetical protein